MKERTRIIHEIESVALCQLQLNSLTEQTPIPQGSLNYYGFVVSLRLRHPRSPRFVWCKLYGNTKAFHSALNVYCVHCM